MRRGHPGISGWRGENSRHFRPRGGQPPHFRPLLQYGSQEPPRFPLGPRFRGPRPFMPHIINSDDGPPDQERPYRGPSHPNNQPRSQGRGGNNDERPRLPFVHKRMQDHHAGSYTKSQMFYEGNSFNTNKMGDVDHRARDVDHRQRDVDLRSPNKYGQAPWMNQPFERRQYHNDKGPPKTSKQHGMGEGLLPPPDLTGHRPPSSDHYSGTSGHNNNNNPYSRSVDDTVDIVRRRLMNRDSTEHTDQSFDQREIDTDMRKNTPEPYHVIPQEQPVKKRVQRHRQKKLNCDKMKNNIVHQLFKMDKGKIHKLMDNPNSSSKFEYAISSLITESQNSFNRHLRSVAEKSLTTSNTRSDFINDDNNTIYEDTFMREMQGLLDPQDTVLLEDIKPLVLAELSKVLCLDDFECVEESGRYQRDDSAYYNDQHDFPHSSYNEYDVEAKHESEFITGDLYEDRNLNIPQQEDGNYAYSQQLSFEEPSPPLFERRPPKQVPKREDRSQSQSSESWQPRQSVDSNTVQNTSNEEIKDKGDEPTRPLFDGNCDQLSDDDDPFADLDNQYHVAVDHTFIEQEDIEIVSSMPEINENETKSPLNVKSDINVNLPVPSTPSNDIGKEIDTQLQSIAKSPIKLFTTDTGKSNNIKVKQEIQENIDALKETSLPKSESEMVKVKSEPTARSDREPVKHGDSGSRNSRKRSVDTKPAHRKEKRKKSSHSECHEEATSIFNMFYVQKPPTKDDKNDTTDKKYSEKYVKRKESHSKDKSSNSSKCDTQKKLNSHSSHSNTSPKTSSNIGEQTPSKIDKTKLTNIDIFSDGAKPKKGAHQAHRNTSTPLAVVKSPDENKIKPIIPTVTTFARKLTKRHVGTQFYTRLRHKECQTAAQKKIHSSTQTSPVKFQKNHCEITEPLERMKEIDMEIQMLLQEKFKLYNSLESKNKTMCSSSSMGTLGMAVLNVPLEADENKDENDDFLADSIAEEFTNLPVEELEQIAMESYSDHTINKSSGKLNRRQKVRQDLSRNNSESPTTRKKKAKIDTPNISLLEQIISNDRPLEEIISLDDLERTPKRSKKKSVPKPSKKKTAKKSNSKPSRLDLTSYNLKECSVVLEHLDLSEYLKKRSGCLKIKIDLKALKHNNHETDTDKLLNKSEITEQPLPVPETILPENPERSSPEPRLQSEEPGIEPVEEVNDLQIDMMEVCEDIVIGDEIKTVSDVNERIPISEEIILDNSQSSAEYATPGIVEGECKMYDYSTDDMLKRDAVTVTGNADAVLAIECIDNSFIAACLDGNVYHFSTDGQLVSTMRGSNLAVTCLTIVKEKYGTTVYTGSLDSRIRYYDLDTGLEKGPECNVLSPIQTMDRAWDTIFVGTRTGFVLQFECKNNMLIPVSTVKFSEQSILALRAMKEGPRKVLLVAARSDNVTVKDAQTGLLLRTLEGPKMTVYTLLFEDGKVYCGTSSHQIHVFDYSSGAHVHVHEGGKGAVCLRATGGLVFAGCYDGCVYVYREGESRPLAQLRGPALMLLSLAIQGTKIIAGYKDRSLYIWKIPLAVLQEMIL